MKKTPESEKQEAPQSDAPPRPKRAYTPPKVESVQLTDEAAESLT